MNVYCERTHVSETIPECATDRQIHGLDLDCQPQSVQLVILGNVGLYHAQGASNLVLTRASLQIIKPPFQIGDKSLTQSI